jgi:hypothetical protein
MRWFTALATPTGFGVADSVEPWSFAIGLEGGYIPSLSEDERRVGFNGIKVEDVNRTSVFGRPTAHLGLPGDFTLSAGWVPPIDFDGVEANLWNFAVARPLWSGEIVRFGGRLFYLTGDLEGDITCPASEVAAGDDPIGNPFACEEPSNDTMSITSWGIELGTAFRVGERTELFLSALWQQVDGEFQVRATYADYVDRDKLEHDGDDFAATAGISWRPDERWRLAGELFYSPLDVVRDRTGRAPSENDALFNFRLAAAWTLR